MWPGSLRSFPLEYLSDSKAPTTICSYSEVDNSWSLDRLCESDSKLYINFEFCEKNKYLNINS